MPTIKPLKPVRLKPARVATPQCDAPVKAPTHHPAWRQQRYSVLRPQWDVNKCQLESAFKIDGKNYCSGHAGRVALRKWLAGELVAAPATENGGGKT